MADFPTQLKIDSKQSKKTPRSGRVIDISGDGVAHVRKMHADKYDFEVLLTRMPSTDRAALFAHYNANPLSTFNFYWPEDGVTYVVKYGDAPEFVDYAKGSGGTTTYRVRLVAGA